MWENDETGGTVVFGSEGGREKRVIGRVWRHGGRKGWGGGGGKG